MDKMNLSLPELTEEQQKVLAHALQLLSSIGVGILVPAPPAINQTLWARFIEWWYRVVRMIFK